MAQGRIPGAEKPRYPEVTKAATEYKAIIRKRLALQETEAEKKDTLIQAMKKRDLTEYVDRDEDPPIEVVLSVKEHVKVNEVKDPTE